MSGAGTSALGRADRLWPAVLASLAAHAVAFSLFGLARPRPALEVQTPIVARLVRLGEPRPKELLPRKEETPPPAAETPAPAPEVAAPAPAPKAVAVPGPAAAPAPRSPARPGPADKAGKPGGARLASVLSQLKQELQAGRADGSPDGDASEAGEGDEYLAAVKHELQARYRLPSTISERDRLHLTGLVVLYIEPDGRISRHELTRRSGNAAFDEALERAVREAHLPPPPPDRRTRYRSGVNIEFRI